LIFDKAIIAYLINIVKGKSGQQKMAERPVFIGCLGVLTKGFKWTKIEVAFLNFLRLLCLKGFIY